MIDPITAKILAQVTVKAVTDEQARKRLLVLVFLRWSNGSCLF